MKANLGRSGSGSRSVSSRSRNLYAARLGSIRSPSSLSQVSWLTPALGRELVPHAPTSCSCSNLLLTPQPPAHAQALTSCSCLCSKLLLTLQPPTNSPTSCSYLSFSLPLTLKPSDHAPTSCSCSSSELLITLQPPPHAPTSSSCSNSNLLFTLQRPKYAPTSCSCSQLFLTLQPLAHAPTPCSCSNHLITPQPPAHAPSTCSHSCSNSIFSVLLQLPPSPPTEPSFLLLAATTPDRPVVLRGPVRHSPDEGAHPHAQHAQGDPAGLGHS